MEPGGDSNPRAEAGFPENGADSQQRAAPGAASCAPGVTDAALARLVAAWAELAHEVQAEIAAIVDGAGAAITPDGTDD